MRTTSRAQKAFIFLFSAGITSIFIINFCAWIFRCGCHSLWAGAAETCNIHHAVGKHCPWCSYGNAGFALAFALILVPQFAISFWPRRLGWKPRLTLAIAAFPVMGALVAGVYGVVSGYW